MRSLLTICEPTNIDGLACAPKKWQFYRKTYVFQKFYENGLVTIKNDCINEIFDTQAAVLSTFAHHNILSTQRNIE